MKYVRVALLLALSLSTVLVSSSSPPEPLLADKHSIGAVAVTLYKVAVVPFAFKPPHCPDSTMNCPVPGNSPNVWPPRNTPDELQAVLDSKVDGYYEKATYGQVRFKFHVIKRCWPSLSDLVANPGEWLDCLGRFLFSKKSFGWWDSPYTWQQYCLANSTGSCQWLKDDANVMRQKAKELADKVLGQNNYHAVISVVSIQERGGNLRSLGILAQEDESDYGLATLVSHELGHAALDLPDLYGPAQCSEKGNLGPWDLMACDSWSFAHFGGWIKRLKKWLPDDAVITIPPPVGSEVKTVKLGPLEIAPWSSTSTSPARVIRLPATPNALEPFVGYYAECRRKTLGDELLPGEGLLITWVDENKKVDQVIAIRPNDPNNVDDKNLSPKVSEAIFQPGYAFSNPSLGIKVSYLSGSPDACDVKIERSVPAEGPPTKVIGLPDLVVKSEDIWIDSEANGWALYDPTDSLDMDGVPSKGDPIWPDHVNAVRFRVRNIGKGPAQNFKVNVYITQPITVAWCGKPVPGPSVAKSVTVWYLGPGQVHKDYVTWNAGKGPAKITVEIEPVKDEFTVSNNIAQRTVHPSYSVPAGSAVGFTVSKVPCPDEWQLEKLNYHVTTKVLTDACPSPDPTDCWRPRSLPEPFALLTGETRSMNIAVIPPKSAKPGDAVEVSIAVFQERGPRGELFQIDEMKVLVGILGQASVNCVAPGRASLIRSAASISGALQPRDANTPIALEYRSPSGRALVRVVSTAIGGGFRDAFVPDEVGAWTVQAYWHGDRDHLPATSQFCSFMVSPLLLPDLAWGRIVVEPTVVLAGQAWPRVYATLINLGNATAEAYSIEMSVMGYSTTIAGPRLQPGQTADIPFVIPGIVNLQPGLYPIVFLADSTRQLVESRKDNNRIIGTLIVAREAAPPPSPRPAPVFAFSISASPSGATLAPGGSTTLRIIVTLVSGSAQPVSLSIEGLPFGTSAYFSPISGSPSFASALTIVTTPRTLPGTYSLTVIGAGGGITQSLVVTLVVTGR